MNKWILGALSTFLVLVQISFTVHANDKVTIGIGEITSSIRGVSPDSFRTMLETQIIKTNKFKVIERARLAEILQEQGLGASGIIDGADEIGGIEGVDYLIYGSITKFGESKSGVAVRGFGSGGTRVEMAIDLRIVDTQTGEVRLAETVENSIKSGSAVKIKGFSQASQKADPLADVQRMAARDVVGLIATTIYPAKIIAVQKNGMHIINYGNALFSEGDFVHVVELGDGFVDPDTGEVLGAEETEIGLLEIVSASAKFSKAQVVSDNGIQKGNIVRKLTEAEIKKAKKAAKKARRKRRKKL
ncbi:MAG: hypothetical protein COB37_02730 [Kordiimonadales bacterium]|nr:MAG: hypothetical protein COB37_02730 [Kordiimonadales bacterium]